MLRLDAIQETVGKLRHWNTLSRRPNGEPEAGNSSRRSYVWDETQRFSPKRGAGLPDHLLSGDSSDLPGLDLAQPAFRLLTPELLSVGIHFPLKARDEPLREAGALSGREL